LTERLIDLPCLLTCLVHTVDMSRRIRNRTARKQLSDAILNVFPTDAAAAAVTD